MMPFDPYLNWLGIPQHDQPPNFYRLLGIVLFESNPQVIEQAADRQSLLVGSYQGGPQGELCQQVLSEIAMARFNLLDPQQKASYDEYLQGTLAERGERAVSAPPPPAMFAAPQQFGPPQPQFGPPPAQFGPPLSQFGPPAQNGEKRLAGPPPPAQSPMPLPQQMPFPAMPQPMTAQAPLPPMPMPAMPQPTMRGPAAMPGPASFRPMAMPGPAPAPIPVAAPFPMASAANSSGNGAAAATMAPPAMPPAAPQRPMDEIESLSSQSRTRRRFAKKKAKKDNGKEIVIGGIAVAFGGLLLIAFLAVRSLNSGPTGYDAVDPAASNSADATKALTSAMKAVQKAKEKDRVAAEHGSQESPLRKMDEPKRREKNSPSAAEGDFIIKAPSSHSETSRLRPIDAPDTHVVTPSPAPSQQQDTPQNLGGDGDPVMELSKPDQADPEKDDR